MSVSNPLSCQVETLQQLQSLTFPQSTQKYHQQKLSREFQTSLSEFQTVQKVAIEKQRASASAARTALDEQTGPSSPEQQHQLGGQQEQEQLRVASQDEVDFQDSLIVERETEIRQIEQSVGELNELFRDVAHIVHDQGEQLDIISENVEGVRVDTQGADRELRSASRYQKSSRNKACCLLIILAVILTIVILAVVLG
jgi:syntaxin 7